MPRFPVWQNIPHNEVNASVQTYTALCRSLISTLPECKMSLKKMCYELKMPRLWDSLSYTVAHYENLKLLSKAFLFLHILNIFHFFLPLFFFSFLASLEDTARMCFFLCSIYYYLNTCYWSIACSSTVKNDLSFVRKTKNKWPHYVAKQYSSVFFWKFQSKFSWINLKNWSQVTWA